MAGRPAKPVQLHLLNGNKRHLTKEEITERQKQEASLRSGTKGYKPSDQVKVDPVALAMFKKLKKLYKEIVFVEGLDENIINRYCQVYSENVALSGIRLKLTELYAVSEIVEQLALADKILEVDKQIEKKRNMLLKIEDRLFLNPTARIKNVPPKQKPQEVDPNAHMFGD